MSRARPRARRSRYRAISRVPRSVPALLTIVFIAGVLLGASLAVVRTVGFLHSVVNFSNPITIVQNEVDPPVGSIAYKLRHGQQVNLLVLGYGGAENDAPYLTDSIMVVTIDPVSRRVVEASVPRDLFVSIGAWQDGRVDSGKINNAFSIPYDNGNGGFAPGPLKPQYQGKDGGGHLAEATVSQVAGLTFDKYVGVDFKAFRDVVDAVGGIDVHMDGPLDDCHYPDYHNGYLNHGVPLGYACPPEAGLHFPAGDYHVDGEQALEIARSRDAVQPDQATDFGRARRQQMILAAIRKKTAEGDAIAKAPRLMDALQKNFRTDMDLNDLKALYDFGGKLTESSYVRMALTNTDLLDDFAPNTRGSCGDPAAYALCPQDPSYGIEHLLFSHALVDPRVLAEHAPVQMTLAAVGPDDLDDRTSSVLRPLGLNVTETPTGRHLAIPRTVIYDYSGGRFPQTAAWLAEFLGATVVPATEPTPGVAASPRPIPKQASEGLVVYLGNDWEARWYGRAGG